MNGVLPFWKAIYPPPLNTTSPMTSNSSIPQQWSHSSTGMHSPNPAPRAGPTCQVHPPCFLQSHVGMGAEHWGSRTPTRPPATPPSPHKSLVFVLKLKPFALAMHLSPFMIKAKQFSGQRELFLRKLSWKLCESSNGKMLKTKPKSNCWWIKHA